MGKWRGKENPTWQGGRSKWNPTCIIVPDDKEIDRTLLIVWPNQGALYDTQINRISSHFCQIGHINSCSGNKIHLKILYKKIISICSWWIVSQPTVSGGDWVVHHYFDIAWVVWHLGTLIHGGWGERAKPPNGWGIYHSNWSLLDYFGLELMLILESN